MLSIFRKISTNITFKIIVALIIFSFVAWGIEGFMKGNTKEYVIAVDNKYFVNPQDYYRTKQNYLRNIESSLGTTLSAEQIKSLNLDNLITNLLINTKLFELLKDELKLEISDNIVADQVKHDENFFDNTKHFNKEYFYKILENNFLSENQLAALIKNEKIRELIIGTLSSDNLYPTGLEEIFSQFFNEKRLVTLAYISQDKLKSLNPTTKDLDELYKENQDNFVIPEFRKISYIEISPESINPNIKILDDEIKEEYKNYIAENYTIEKRDIYNVIINNKEKAEEALKLLKAGNDFLRVAEKYSDRPLDKLLMKNIIKSDLPAELQTETFELQKDEFSNIIASNSGYHIIKLLNISKISHPKYEIIKEDLYKNLVKKKSEELLYEYIKDIEDNINSSSKTIHDIAKEFNLNVKVLDSMNKEGLNFKGEKIILPEFPNLMNNIFAKNLKDMELLEEQASSKYYLFSIDEINEKRNKTFAEANKELIKLWYEKEMHNKAMHIIAQIKQNLNNNVSLAQVASDLHLEVVEKKYVYRDLTRNNELTSLLPQNLIQDILSTEKLKLTNSYNFNDQYIIAQVNDINFETDNFVSNRKNIPTLLQEQFQQSFIEDLLSYLRTNHNIQVNSK